MRYRPVFVFLAIGVVVVVSIVVSLGDPSGKTAIPVVIGMVAVLVVGILLYQWLWVGGQEKEMERAADEAVLGGPVSDAGDVDTWQRMIPALAVERIDPKQLKKAGSGMSGVMRINILAAAIVSALGIGFTSLVLLGGADSFNVGAWKYWPIVPFALAPFAVLFVRYMLTRAGEAGGDYLKPIGLAITQMPEVGIAPTTYGSHMKSSVEGSTVVEGKRHGRNVRIEMDAKVQRTMVEAKVPAFTVDADSDALVAGERAPAGVRKVIDSSKPSKRWNKVKSVEGGADGIVVERKVDTQNGWMWDLWLAEKLADEAKAGR